MKKTRTEYISTSGYVGFTRIQLAECDDYSFLSGIQSYPLSLCNLIVVF